MESQPSSAALDSLLQSWDLCVDDAGKCMNEDGFFKKITQIKDSILASKEMQQQALPLKLCRLLVIVKPSDTEIGRGIYEVQEVFFKQFSDNFFTLKVGKEEKKIPREWYKTLMGERATTALGHAWKEEQDGVVEFILSNDLGKDTSKYFFDFIERGAKALSDDDSVLDLLRFAQENDISSLGNACVDLIKKYLVYANTPNDRFLKILIYAFSFDINAPEYIQNLRWSFLLGVSHSMAKYEIEKISDKALNQFLQSFRDFKNSSGRFSFSEDGYRQISYSCMQSVNLDEQVDLCRTVNALKITDTDITDKQLGDLCRMHNRIRKLDISGCYLITNQGLQEVSQICGGTLEELIIDSCRKTSFDNCKFPALRKLSAREINLTNEGLQLICSTYGKTLECLDIGGNRWITGFDNCKLPALRELRASSTDITNNSLQVLSKLCSNTLKLLEIMNCKKITSFPQDDFPNLTHLGAYGTGLTQSELMIVIQAIDRLNLKTTSTNF